MAASNTVGTAIVKLSFDGKGVSSELDSMEKQTSGFGDKVKSIAGGIGKALAAGFAVASTAAIAFAKSSVDAFNVQEEALAKLNQTAKNQNWTTEAVEDLKSYNSELQKVGIIGDEVAAAGQAQLGTFGLTSEAVKTLTPALDDLIAATSGYGATTDNAASMANLLGKVMTGSTSALTRYGVTLNENQKKLLENGNEAQKAATLVEVLRQNYGGFNEALAQTPQGKVKQLSNNFGDLKEQFGGFIAGKGDLSGFFDTLNTVFDNIIDLVTTMAPQVIQGITTLLQAIMEKLPGLIVTLMPTIASALVELAKSFINSLPAFIQALIDIIIAIAEAIIDNLPTILTAIVNAIIQIAMVLTNPENMSRILKAAITLLMQLVKCIPQIIVALLKALPDIIMNIVRFLTDPNNIKMIIKGAVELFFGIVKAVPEILLALIQAFGNLIGQLWNWITSAFGEFAGNFGNFIGNIFRGAINGVLSFIENVINTPIRILNGFIGIINDAFGWIGVNLGYIGEVGLPRLAQGGIVSSTTIAMIGEEGKEAVIPLENNTDNWAGTLASILTDKMEMDGSSGKTEIVVNMTNQINNDMDAADIGRKLMQSIRRAA